MVRIQKLRMTLGVALIAAAPLLLGATDLSSNFEQRVLAAQNRERAALGLPPMIWDAALAASARHWASDLALSGRFEHSPFIPSNPQGENLWAGTRGYFPVEASVNAWLREKQNFVPGVFPNNSRTGRVQDVGHYTQIVWRDTGRVGCAMATGQAEDVLGCRYSQPGNWRGERPF
jgi:uncharacterized protein YkwD